MGCVGNGLVDRYIATSSWKRKRELAQSSSVGILNSQQVDSLILTFVKVDSHVILINGWVILQGRVVVRTQVAGPLSKSDYSKLQLSRIDSRQSYEPMIETSL